MRDILLEVVTGNLHTIRKSVGIILFDLENVYNYTCSYNYLGADKVM